MGHSRHRKWYEKNDGDDFDSHRQADNFKSRRQKRLRTITTKHVDQDKEDTDYDDDQHGV